MTGGLLQLSGVVIDLVHRIDNLPAPGEEVETSEFMMTAGGGFNAMAAARRMGARVTYGGVLGEGPFSDIARHRLSEEGIAIANTLRAAIDQGSCAVIVDKTGERSFITHHGAERKVDEAHLEALHTSSYAFALLTGYSLYKPETAAAFLPWLLTLSRPPLLIFDPGPTVADIPSATLRPVLSRADWVSANAQEARVLNGEADPARAAKSLAEGRKGALVRRGADGCWLACDGNVIRIPGFDVTCIDSNGAGDTHDGVFIAALMAGVAPDDAALVANAAAALSTTRIGPATSPDLTETLRFLEASGRMPNATDFWERVQSGEQDAQQEEENV